MATKPLGRPRKVKETTVQLRDRKPIPFSTESLGKRRLGQYRKAGYNPELGEDGVWSDELRIEAVTAYIALGKMPFVTEQTGIPTNTLWSWKKHSNWWTDLERTIRGEQNNEYSAVIGDIVSSSLLCIKDRVKKGDFVYNPRSGETVRVPLSAKDLNQVVNTMLDKRGKLVKENLAEPDRAVDEKTLENKLTQLADAFKSFVVSRSVTTIDMGEVEALSPEQR